MLKANEQFGNNILVNLENSFVLCNYLTQQYLTENLLRFDSFMDTKKKLTDVLEFMKKHFKVDSLTDFKNLYYNKHIHSLTIPEEDYMLNIIDLKENIKNQIKKLKEKLKKYKEEEDILISIGKDKTNVHNKSTLKEAEIAAKEKLITKLDTISIKTITSFSLTEIEHKIIERYNSLLSNMKDQRGCYMYGWNALFNNNSLLKNSQDIVIQRIINEEYSVMKEKNDKIDINDIEILKPYYQHLAHIVEPYFKNPKYISKNKVLGFVRDLLIHLTENVLCHGIEIIIRKVLFEQLQKTKIDKPVDDIVDKMNYMLDDTLELLYKNIAKTFVLNSVNVFNDETEEAEHERQDVEEILNNFFDLLKTNSPIEISEYTIKVFKSYIVPYFATIIPKTINNWNVCIENQFMFIINHSRIIQCFSILLN